MFGDLFFNRQALGWGVVVHVTHVSGCTLLYCVRRAKEAPSSGRDASLVFKDLIFNTQALGWGVVAHTTHVYGCYSSVLYPTLLYCKRGLRVVASTTLHHNTPHQAALHNLHCITLASELIRLWWSSSWHVMHLAPPAGRSPTDGEGTSPLPAIGVTKSTIIYYNIPYYSRIEWNRVE